MADIRIKIAKDKAKLVKALRAGEGATGPFQTYVDIMIFAASLGIKHRKNIPILEFSKKDPEPIPKEHFMSRGMTHILDLLAIHDTGDPGILANNELSEKKRINIFEGYANGGLEILQEKFKFQENYSNRILLIILHEKIQALEHEDPFNLDFLREI
jgi:dnd system-associated protein 4